MPSVSSVCGKVLCSAKYTRIYGNFGLNAIARSIKMANFVVLNDNTLRQRLRQFGFRPDGPITETTRDVYVRKLQRLERTRGALTATAPLQPLASRYSNGPLFSFTSTTPRSSALQGNHHRNELVARSAPSGNVNTPSNNIVHGSLGNRFFANFNNRTHVTSDVCFISQDGTVLFASRALLATSCPGMTHLLYNTSEPLPICLHMATGSTIIWCRLDDSVRSIKYKIALLKGIPVMNQSLLLDGQILADGSTLHSCGVRTNSLLELQASSTHSVVRLRATSINPSLSVVKFAPLASLSRDDLPAMSREELIPHQVTQLIIVSGVSGTLLNDFIRYLYTGNIAITIESAPTLCALSEAFTMEDLQQLSLNVVDDNINNRNIKDLLFFAHSNEIPSLKDHCLQYIRRGQCNVDQLCQHFHNYPELLQAIMSNNTTIS